MRSNFITDVAIWFCACIVTALAMSGCATVNTPPNATAEQKLIADAQAVAGVVNDVKAKCGPQLAPLGPVIMSVLQIAASPQDVLNDIMAVVQAAPDIYKDGQAIACAIRTVVDDLKALKPKPGTQQALMLEMAQQTLVALDRAALFHMQQFALVDVPPICDPDATDMAACRPVTVDDDFPETLNAQTKTPCALTEAKRSSQPRIGR